MRLGRRWVSMGNYVLALLDCFEQPKRVAEALAELRPRVAGARDWIELTRTLAHLTESGVLVPEEAAAAAPEARGLDRLDLHARMLDDLDRVRAYTDALRQVVTPDSVVLDLGTGTGVLAIAAARAGARRVYAVEAGGIAAVAEEMFRLNGVADRVTLVHGWSTRISLPERADVLVGEIIGNDPFCEGVLEAYADARARLLRPGAAILPQRVRLYAVPVTLPAEHRAPAVSPEHVSRWRESLGIDFSPLGAAATRALGGRWTYAVRPVEARAWPRLGRGCRLAEVDLATAQASAVCVERELRVESPGRLDAVLLYFELELAPGVTLTTDPAAAADACSWTNPVWEVPGTPDVKAGDLLGLCYRYEGGESALSLEPPESGQFGAAGIRAAAGPRG